jgi:16S rRNA (uracil1498-N3)-methyltransferase
MTNITKSPRLYTETALSAGQNAALDGNAHHYLRNVMRAAAGDTLRLFNGRDGEFSGHITAIDKKSAVIKVDDLLRPQPHISIRRALLFSPLKKERMDFLIEKSVELGVTDFHPLIMQHSDVRQINAERIRAQMIEAAEQCERLTLPVLHDLTDIKTSIRGWDKDTTLFAAIERVEAKPLSAQTRQNDCGLLIGPAGGFSQDEKDFITAQSHIRCVSLGDHILRAETAAIAGLALLAL